MEFFHKKKTLCYNVSSKAFAGINLLIYIMFCRTAKRPQLHLIRFQDPFPSLNKYLTTRIRFLAQNSSLVVLAGLEFMTIQKSYNNKSSLLTLHLHTGMPELHVHRQLTVSVSREDFFRSEANADAITF